MAKTTTNYGLTKPERSDNYSVDVMANNMDVIDTKLKSIDNITNDGDVESSSITNSGNITTNTVNGTTADFESYSGSNDYATDILSAIYIPAKTIVAGNNSVNVSFTWKQSRFCSNTMTFRISAHRYSSSSSMTMYVNGSSKGTASSSENHTTASKDITVTLNDGDVVKFVGSGSTASDSGLKATMLGFYLI